MLGISIKSAKEIDKMRQAGKLAAQVLDMIEPYVKPGVSTLELNNICDEFTLKHGAISAPLNYRGFPKSICTSINNVVCHGIPSAKEILKDGDIVNLDITVKMNGYHGDTSRTFLVGKGHPVSTIQLVERTYNAMMIGIQQVKAGAYFGDIGSAIDDYISPFGYGIVRDLTGHGIGSTFHEEPQVFHHKQIFRGARMKAGMIFTIEPMINAGSYEVDFDKKDKWTVRTVDHSLSAQFEHTILVTDTGCEILTASEKLLK